MGGSKGRKRSRSDEDTGKAAYGETETIVDGDAREVGLISQETIPINRFWCPRRTTEEALQVLLRAALGAACPDIPHFQCDMPMGRHNHFVLSRVSRLASLIESCIPKHSVHETRGERQFARVMNMSSKVGWKPYGHIGRASLNLEVKARSRDCAAHFQFDGFGCLAPDEHAQTMIDGLVESSVVRKNKGEVHGFAGTIEEEVPV